ncbi:unnamed protein product [Mycena citricolor]|uniref:Uncharacterized protein n=1 Tax=Mycena citricolor TaxID=2018698 RepID=A0AAD2GRU1_9AGAR|nr:unnamed protein product [Mycena citricolor]
MASVSHPPTPQNAASSGPWADLDAISNALPYFTVSDLKSIIEGVNMRCAAVIRKSGNKPDLVDRLRQTFKRWRDAGQVNEWELARSVLEKNGSGRFVATFSRRDNLHAQQQQRAAYHPPSISAPGPAAPLRPAMAFAPHPHAPIAKPAYIHYQPPPPVVPTYRFKDSPFFTVEESVCPMLECPESLGPSDRRDVELKFNLSPAQLEKLSSGCQAHLFCTSSKFYSPSRSTNADCLIDFPPTCEIYINNVQLKSSLVKGIKKRPGTAPPPNIALNAPGGGSVLTARNVVRMIYIDNTGQNETVKPPPRKFYMVVQIVQPRSVETLVEQVRTNNSVSSADVRKQMFSSMSDDDDIIAGSIKLPLKCPLSFMRIRLPCRSRRCKHSQCFDATSWFSVMQQTTTWQCPVCENMLDWRELIIDGFFVEILDTTPDSVEDVILDADGVWRTPDGRYTSAMIGTGVVKSVEYEYIDDSDDDD